jgi:hypothetical protein
MPRMWDRACRSTPRRSPSLEHAHTQPRRATAQDAETQIAAAAPRKAHGRAERANSMQFGIVDLQHQLGAPQEAGLMRAGWDAVAGDAVAADLLRKCLRELLDRPPCCPNARIGLHTLDRRSAIRRKRAPDRQHAIVEFPPVSLHSQSAPEGPSAFETCTRSRCAKESPTAGPRHVVVYAFETAKQRLDREGGRAGGFG